MLIEWFKFSKTSIGKIIIPRECMLVTVGSDGKITSKGTSVPNVDVYFLMSATGFNDRSDAGQNHGLWGSPFLYDCNNKLWAPAVYDGYIAYYTGKGAPNNCLHLMGLVEQYRIECRVHEVLRGASL